MHPPCIVTRYRDRRGDHACMIGTDEVVINSTRSCYTAHLGRTHYTPRVAQRRVETAHLLLRQGDSFLSVHNQSDAQRAMD